MGHDEKIWLGNFKSEILFYRRYVDDTFSMLTTVNYNQLGVDFSAGGFFLVTCLFRMREAGGASVARTGHGEDHPLGRLGPDCPVHHDVGVHAQGGLHRGRHRPHRQPGQIPVAELHLSGV